MIKKALITGDIGKNDSSNDVTCIQSHVMANVYMLKKFSYKFNL